MCVCKQISREGTYPAYWYAFECTDNSGHKKFFSFSMANDNEAKEYAESLCSESFIDENERIVINENSRKAQAESKRQLAFSSNRFSCISMFPGGYMRYGLRNNCANCMTAVIYSSDDNQTDYYKIPGQSQIIVEMHHLSEQLIGDQPC